MSELAYGSEKARSLFREMIQKASYEVGFEAEDTPLMVEAIPLSNESVVLLITKIEDPEELDTRFSRFSPPSDEESGDVFGGLTSELLEGAGDLLNLLNSGAEKRSETEDTTEEAAGPADGQATGESVSLTRIYMFEGLDQATEAAKIVGHVFKGANTLYKKPDARVYFLVLKSAGSDPLEYSRICNILAEYGSKVRQDIGTEAYFQEHYEVLIQENALQCLSRL